MSEGVERTQAPFRFYGDGAEYFRIWIVNLVLTILTLGIYSAWATVRNKRYFYGNTELDGDRFDYLADPVAILKGRLIAIGALVLYSLAQYFEPALSLLFFLLLLIGLPFIVVRAMRFNALMSAWRGIRFGFDGGYGEAAKAFLLWPLFGVVTLGFGMPYAWHKQNLFLINHYRFGQTRANTTATSSDFFTIFFILMGISIAAMMVFFFVSIALGAAIGLSGEGEAGDAAAQSAVVGLTVVFGFMYFVLLVGLGAAYQALHFRVVYDNIQLADNEIHNGVGLGSWVWIVFTNSLLMLITLGLYYPWAKVRMTRYILDNLWVEAVDLQSFVASESDVESALGQEMGEAFDLGIGV